MPLPINDWEKQAHPERGARTAAQLRTEAEELRRNAMMNAYQRHDMRKGKWDPVSDHHKRQLALRRLELSQNTALGYYWQALKMRLDKDVQRHQEAYARARPMPTDAEQTAGFSSSHQLSLLPALKNDVLRTAHSSLHQFQRTAKALAPAFYAWEKRASMSHEPGVQKVGTMETELKAVSSW
ncbi:MAG: hypothetical protein M1826_006945 [Phylliscum demangeonii]|nr:MAG: hypothetical protein M1826_006945 [Phylliscum demangeonii]